MLVDGINPGTRDRRALREHVHGLLPTYAGAATSARAYAVHGHTDRRSSRAARNNHQSIIKDASDNHQGAATRARHSWLDRRSRRSYHPVMPMWRCPHCGTPQAETARCWVCHRSSTACATCRNYRRSVAGPLGYCGLDRQRQPLRGDEIRACWEATNVVVEAQTGPVGPAPHPATTADEDRTPVRRLEFVEVRSTAPTARPKRTAAVRPAGQDTAVAATPAETQVAIAGGESRWSLWGDGEL